MPKDFQNIYIKANNGKTVFKALCVFIEKIEYEEDGIYITYKKNSRNLSDGIFIPNEFIENRKLIIE